MTLQDKLNKAEELYHTVGKNYEAIELYNEILDSHNDQSMAWFNLASLKFQIADFDGCFSAYYNAQRLEPENNRFHHMYITYLSSISSFEYKKPFFFDNKTREAHTIKTFGDKIELINTLISELKKSLKYLKKGERGYYNNIFQIGMKNRDIGNNIESVKFYLESLDFIPEKLDSARTKRKKRTTYLNIAIAFKNEKKWNDAKENILKAKTLGLDDFHNELVEEILGNAD